MKKNKEKREPLMYIHQPNFVCPEPVMQATYHTKDQPKQKKEIPAEEKQTEKNQKKAIHEAVKKERPMMEGTKRKERETEPAAPKVEQQPEEKQEVQEQPTWIGMRPVKRFHDMEMDEKLQHLTKQFTSIPCLFDCGEVSHKGILREVTPDEIKVRTIKGETVTVKRKELKTINMLGPT